MWLGDSRPLRSPVSSFFLHHPTLVRPSVHLQLSPFFSLMRFRSIIYRTFEKLFLGGQR
jgi:hypothetical protein